jgi:hypothetical protein
MQPPNQQALSTYYNRDTTWRHATNFNLLEPRTSTYYNRDTTWRHAAKRPAEQTTQRRFINQTSANISLPLLLFFASNSFNFFEKVAKELLHQLIKQKRIIVLINRKPEEKSCP